MNVTTPDGLIVHELRGVGLVVSASKHNKEVHRLREALFKCKTCNIPDYVREVVNAALRPSDLANT